MARKKQNNNGASLGFEEKLWQAADKMRGHMDAAEYKHVALGLVFLKYISDAFEEFRDKLAAIEGASRVRLTDKPYLPASVSSPSIQSSELTPRSRIRSDDRLTI